MGLLGLDIPVTTGDKFELSLKCPNATVWDALVSMAKGLFSGTFSVTKDVFNYDTQTGYLEVEVK